MGYDMTDVERVKRFIEKSDDSMTIEEISDITGIAIEAIEKMIQAGEVTLNSKLEEKHKRCAKCKKIIYSGRYCEECILDISGQLKAAFMNDRKRIVSDDQNRMRFVRN